MSLFYAKSCYVLFVIDSVVFGCRTSFIFLLDCPGSFLHRLFATWNGAVIMERVQLLFLGCFQWDYGSVKCCDFVLLITSHLSLIKISERFDAFILKKFDSNPWFQRRYCPAVRRTKGSDSESLALIPTFEICQRHLHWIRTSVVRIKVESPSNRKYLISIWNGFLYSCVGLLRITISFPFWLFFVH